MKMKTDRTDLQFNPTRLIKEMMNHSLIPVTTTNLKFADYLKSLEKESSLSLAACTCFRKLDGVRQFLLTNFDSAVRTRSTVANALKFLQLPRYEYTYIAPQEK